MSINVEQTLKERFAAPLADNYVRRIVFWQDPDGEFSDFVDELDIDDVKILKLTGANNFYAKQLLSEVDTESNYLVYNPILYRDIKDNWLLDIELYSEEFRADLLSIRMQELDLPQNAQMRKAVKSYNKFFENKERVAKLKSFGSDYTTVRQLHIDVLAVLAGANTNTVAGVIQAVLMNGLDVDENEAITGIKKFGNEEALWNLIGQHAGYIYDGSDSLIGLAAHILLTTLSITMKPECFHGLEKLISEQHQQFCYALVDEWMNSEDEYILYDITRSVERRHDLEERFNSLEVDELLDSECLPCINECILKKFMTEISEGVIRADDIVNAIEKRRTMRWFKRVRNYYDGLLQVANMQHFYQDNISGFHIAEYRSLWKEYCDDYCRMDLFYRLFHTAFGKSFKDTNTALEDLFKSVADYVEKLYKNWFLAQLGSQWTKLVSDEMSEKCMLADIPQQTDFYRRYVQPITVSGSRAFVIISDALRFEVGKELAGRLIRETRGNAKIEGMQSVFPSVTKFGMAAILPHEKLQMTDDIKVLCDGESTDDTASRDKVLKNYHRGNVAVTYKTLLGMKTAERRELISDAKIVYIYHNTIDAVGDKVQTEDQVFEACEDAVAELKNMVRLITNDMNGTNIVITADHGFLYSFRPLEESDKAEKSFISGNILELDRRYAITDGDCTAEHMLRIPMDHVESGYVGFTPLDNIRMKKQGGGMNYVHGGISLQEMVVPVIRYKNVKTSSKNFEEVKKAEIKLLSQSRKVSNSIFSLNFYQTEPVSGKLIKADYEIYMADAAGRAVSDKQTVIADKTESEASERGFRVRFTLKSADFKKTDTYYLIVVEKGTTNVIERVEFTIDIAFVNDFDF